MAGITIPIAADTREAAKGVSDLSKGFDQVADSLDDVAKSGDKAGDKLEGSLRDAQRETKQTTDAFQKLAREQKDAARSGDDFGTSGSSGLKKLGQTSEEVGGELRQNIGETFSSFRGDITDFGQIAQDTLGGLASGLEGIPGVAAVAAGAAGLGLLLGALEQGQVNAEQFQTAVSNLAGVLIDAGTSGTVPIEHMVDVLKAAATGGDDLGHTLKDLKKAADNSGNSYETLAKAYAGNVNGLKDLWREGQKRLKQMQDEQVGLDTGNKAQADRYAALAAQIQAQKDLNGYVGQSLGVAKEAADAQQLYAQAGGPELEAKAELIKNIDSAYDDAAGSASDYVDAESGVFNVDAYINAMTAKAQALDEYKTNLQKAALSLSPEAISFLESQGVEGASTLVQAYINGTDAQKAALAGIWGTAGKTSADSYTNSLKAGIPTTLPGPTVSARADMSSAQAEFDKFFKLNNGKEITQYVVAKPGHGNG